MADEVVGGLDRDLAAKQAAKYDPTREAEARSWIEIVLNEPLPSESFQESLKDGIILCRLINILQPSQNVKFTASKLAFKQLKRQSSFKLLTCLRPKNMVQVIDFIYALSRNASANGYDGPRLGPKLAEKREIHFSDEQISQGKTVIGLQLGVGKGSGATGLIYGNRREIGGADPGKLAQ
ncbi:calponin homology domain-containing protein [Chytridium lagenaria]|nr:calponin homology domain-containing protein [Chytridium lagenaria]